MICKQKPMIEKYVVLSDISDTNLLPCKGHVVFFSYVARSFLFFKVILRHNSTVTLLQENEHVPYYSK